MWYLVLILYGSGVVFTPVPFDSMQECNKAGWKWVEGKKNSSDARSFECIKIKNS